MVGGREIFNSYDRKAYGKNIFKSGAGQSLKMLYLSDT